MLNKQQATLYVIELDMCLCVQVSLVQWRNYIYMIFSVGITTCVALWLIFTADVMYRPEGHWNTFSIQMPKNICVFIWFDDVIWCWFKGLAQHWCISQHLLLCWIPTLDGVCAAAIIWLSRTSTAVVQIVFYGKCIVIQYSGIRLLKACDCNDCKQTSEIAGSFYFLF